MKKIGDEGVKLVQLACREIGMLCEINCLPFIV